MSVDYDGVGGIGILLTDEIIEKLMDGNLFTKEEWDNDKYECVERLNVSYQTAGNAYSGDTHFYLLVEGSTLAEINYNADEFINWLVNNLGFNIDYNDLMVISDIYVS